MADAIKGKIETAGEGPRAAFVMTWPRRPGYTGGVSSACRSAFRATTASTFALRAPSAGATFQDEPPVS